MNGAAAGFKVVIPARLGSTRLPRKVLREIGAAHIPQILVWNQIDAAGLEPAVERDEHDKIARVFISARTGEGLDLLRSSITEAAQVQREANLRPKDDTPPDAISTFTDV